MRLTLLSWPPSSESSSPEQPETSHSTTVNARFAPGTFHTHHSGARHLCDPKNRINYRHGASRTASAMSMTRPPQAGPRPPQRSLSGTGMLQRQAQQRSHLQQSQQPSPGRASDSAGDTIADGAQTASPRLEPSKPGGSMVRVEGLTAQKQNIVSMESPSQAGTPGAVLPLPQRARPRFPFRRHDAQADAPKLVGSPQKSSAYLPLPMPARPGRSGVSHVRKKTHDGGNSPKKETRPKPYVLEAPSDAPSYPPNGMNSALFEMDFTNVDRAFGLLPLDREPRRRHLQRYCNPSRLFR